MGRSVKKSTRQVKQATKPALPLRKEKELKTKTPVKAGKPIKKTIQKAPPKAATIKAAKVKSKVTPLPALPYKTSPTRPVKIQAAPVKAVKKPLPKAPKPPKAPKANKPSGPKGYNPAEYAKFKDFKEKFEDYSNQKLKDLLRANMQSMTGNKDELVYKSADGATLGRIPRCPKCFGGRPKFDYQKGTYYCSGYRDDEDFKNCQSTFQLGEITRDAWTDI